MRVACSTLWKIPHHNRRYKLSHSKHKRGNNRNKLRGIRHSLKCSNDRWPGSLKADSVTCSRQCGRHSVRLLHNRNTVYSHRCHRNSRNLHTADSMMRTGRSNPVTTRICTRNTDRKSQLIGRRITMNILIFPNPC